MSAGADSPARFLNEGITLRQSATILDSFDTREIEEKAKEEADKAIDAELDSRVEPYKVVASALEYGMLEKDSEGNFEKFYLPAEDLEAESIEDSLEYQTMVDSLVEDHKESWIGENASHLLAASSVYCGLAALFSGSPTAAAIGVVSGQLALTDYQHEILGGNDFDRKVDHYREEGVFDAEIEVLDSNRYRAKHEELSRYGEPLEEI